MIHLIELVHWFFLQSTHETETVGGLEHQYTRCIYQLRLRRDIEKYMTSEVSMLYVASFYGFEVKIQAAVLLTSRNEG